MEHELSPNVSRIRKGAAITRDHEPGQKQDFRKIAQRLQKFIGL
jgi:hypothetical protein